MKYNEKNMKICEICGAKQFQKFVFWLEKNKYEMILKFFPDICSWYDKYNERKMKRKLVKCQEKEKKAIIDEYRFQKLLFRKELINKQNQNYHMDLENPTNFSNYLKFNKKLHVDGLKVNVILIGLMMMIKLFLNNPVCNLLLIYNLISMIINWQCINLQNYNLCRLENDEMKSLLERRENRSKAEKQKKYGEGMKVIGKTFQETDDIPTINDVIKNVETNEEKKQLLLYLKKQLEDLERKNNNIEVKAKGRIRERWNI